MMHPSTISSLLLPLLALPITLASPTPIDLQPRACTTILPTSYQQILSTNPTLSTPQSNNFKVSQSAASGSQNTLISFAGLPAGAYGCTLGWSFTYGYPITSSGNNLLDVYALTGPVSAADTWSTYYPAGGKTPTGTTGGVFGTTHLAPGQKAVVNSEACPAAGGQVGFLVQLEGDADGDVEFVDAGNNLSGIGGFYLSFNC